MSDKHNLTDLLGVSSMWSVAMFLSKSNVKAGLVLKQDVKLDEMKQEKVWSQN